MKKKEQWVAQTGCGGGLQPDGKTATPNDPGVWPTCPLGKRLRAVEFEASKKHGPRGAGGRANRCVGISMIMRVAPHVVGNVYKACTDERRKHVYAAPFVLSLLAEEGTKVRNCLPRRKSTVLQSLRDTELENDAAKRDHAPRPPVIIPMVDILFPFRRLIMIYTTKAFY